MHKHRTNFKRGCVCWFDKCNFWKKRNQRFCKFFVAIFSKFVAFSIRKIYVDNWSMQKRRTFFFRTDNLVSCSYHRVMCATWDKRNILASSAIILVEQGGTTWNKLREHETQESRTAHSDDPHFESLHSLSFSMRQRGSGEPGRKCCCCLLLPLWKASNTWGDLGHLGLGFTRSQSHSGLWWHR